MLGQEAKQEKCCSQKDLWELLEGHGMGFVSRFSRSSCRPIYYMISLGWFLRINMPRLKRISPEEFEIMPWEEVTLP